MRIVTPGLAFLAILPYLAFFSSPLKAQAVSERERRELLAQSQKNAEEYVRAIRPPMFSGLRGEEATIYRDIKFRVSDDDAAWRTSSYVEDGTRIVEMDVGYVRKVEMLAEAVMLESMLDKQVLIPYIRYVAKSLNDKATFIKSPSTFERVDPSRIDNEPVRHKQEIAMVLNALAFVLAHEVGHHVLGHYDKPIPDDMDARRKMEGDADAWALQRCVQAHFSPLGGALAVMFEYYTTPQPIRHEEEVNHPADVRRLHAIFEAMIGALPEFRADIEKKGASYAEFSRFIREQLRTYERQVETGETPVERPSTRNQNASNDDDVDQDVEDRPKKRTRLGAYCGDIHGTRYCPMVRSMPLGSACTCSNLPGWGVVVR
jgi:hypothetical protein